LLFIECEGLSTVGAGNTEERVGVVARAQFITHTLLLVFGIMNVYTCSCDVQSLLNINVK